MSQSNPTPPSTPGSEQTTHQLATGEDLREAARLSNDAGMSHGNRKLPRVQNECFARADRLYSFAAALDQLHAIPGLQEAMERVQRILDAQRGHPHPSPDLLANTTAVGTLLTALHCVYHPGETK